MPRRTISRRTLLRGAGASLALPWLDAMVPAARASTIASPKRLVVFFLPNGMWLPDFTPATTGASYTMPWLLEPLAPVRDKVLVLSGLSNAAGPGEPHSAATGALLTGLDVNSEQGATLAAGTSMDQVVAQAIGSATTFPSLQLGSEGDFLCDVQGQGGFDAFCAYMWNLSWANATTPLPKDVHPPTVFRRLFGDLGLADSAAVRAKRRRYEQAILDSVLDDAGRLSATLGTEDRQRLDGYLTGIHELEQRLLVVPDPPPGCGVSAQGWTDAWPDDVAWSAPQRVQQMIEIMTLALECDLTRVVTYMLGTGRSDRPYPWLGIPESHHELSHHGDDQAKIIKLRQICRWEMEQVASFLTALDSKVQPDGQTLLDSTMVLVCSGIGEPNSHDFHDLPVLVAGSGNGAIQTGRHLAFSQDEPIADLHVALMQAMGLTVSSLGTEGTGPLSGILASVTP